MKTLPLVLILLALAWYGHHHDWGFWVYVLVFFAGVGVGMGDEGVERSEEYVASRRPVSDRLSRLEGVSNRRNPGR